jgi:hypothetical protein
MTDKLTTLQIDVSTGEHLIRDLTADEIAEKSKIALEASQEQAAKEAIRTSALAKLAALGLTEEEIAAL